MSVQIENVQNCKVIAHKTNVFPSKKGYSETADIVKDVKEAKDGMNKEDNKNQPRSECTTCQLEFSSRSQLSEHMSLKHKVCPYRCKKCKRSFHNKLELNDHQAIHTITDAASFSCGECSLTFLSAQYLNCHMRDVHSGKKFNCDICSKSFRAQRYLNEHKSKIHSGKEKPKCSICHKEFRGKGELKTHSVIHTGERPYKCLICSKSFRARSNLDVHMKIHNGIKDFVCNICGKGFIVKNDLKRHLALHVGIKAFSCDECGKQFSRKYQLEKHSYAVHKKNKSKDPSNDDSTFEQSVNKSNVNISPILPSVVGNSGVKNPDVLNTSCAQIEENKTSVSANNNGDQFVIMLPQSSTNNNNNNGLIFMDHNMKDVVINNQQDINHDNFEPQIFILDESSCDGDITLSNGEETVVITTTEVGVVHDTSTMVINGNGCSETIVLSESDSVQSNIVIGEDCDESSPAVLENGTADASMLAKNECHVTTHADHCEAEVINLGERSDLSLDDHQAVKSDVLVSSNDSESLPESSQETANRIELEEGSTMPESAVLEVPSGGSDLYTYASII
eukprot:TRINITY_DN1930_c1_g1_i4.p1 TRINITY_DN1930_c1_g1~~TRINITY_DN1930_c1_g1_i4.p1  ORF type:complete len:564 (+),score=75.10 TRINITY_DN1930_c1_g1_i4:155-1846(+)